MPFALAQIPGTTPIGRAAVWEGVLYEYAGEPVIGQSLLAAFWVTDDDPLRVTRAWADQLDRLSVDRVSVSDAPGPGMPWLQIRSYSEDPSTRPDSADLQLWTTESQPILLVSIARVRDDSSEPKIEDNVGDPRPPAPVVSGGDRRAGDPLFTEQGDTLHLPAGTRTLTPTIPVFGGTGGSASVLAADDGRAAIEALLAEAEVVGDYDGADEVVVEEFAGAEVVRGSFVIPAGGWGFWAVSVRAPGDEYATVYVNSAAD